MKLFYTTVESILLKNKQSFQKELRFNCLSLLIEMYSIINQSTISLFSLINPIIEGNEEKEFEMEIVNDNTLKKQQQEKQQQEKQEYVLNEISITTVLEWCSLQSWGIAGNLQSKRNRGIKNVLTNGATSTTLKTLSQPNLSQNDSKILNNTNSSTLNVVVLEDNDDDDFQDIPVKQSQITLDNHNRHKNHDNNNKNNTNDNESEGQTKKRQRGGSITILIEDNQLSKKQRATLGVNQLLIYLNRQSLEVIDESKIVLEKSDDDVIIKKENLKDSKTKEELSSKTIGSVEQVNLDQKNIKGEKKRLAILKVRKFLKENQVKKSQNSISSSTTSSTTTNIIDNLSDDAHSLSDFETLK